MDKLDIRAIRGDFPALREYVYLNTASISLMPMPVQALMREFSDRINYAGTVSFDEEAEIGSVENTRALLARLLNGSPENLAVISSATEGLCQVAWGLQPKGKILVVDIEFPSGVTPWVRVARQTGAEIQFIRVKDRPADLLLEEIVAAIDDRVSVVCVGHAQYSNGLVIDIHALAEACHRKNALCVVDAVQSAGVVPIDLAGSQVDALVVGGYKWLCGPFGAAALYIGDRLRERIEPAFVGWRSMENPYQLDATRYAYNSGLRGYEFSTVNYAAGYALGESVRYILNIGVENIHRQALRVSRYLADRLESAGATVLTPREDSRRTGTVFARFPGLDGEAVAARLNQSGVIVSPRMGGARFSCHFFNSEEDVDRAVEALEQILKSMRQ